MEASPRTPALRGKPQSRSPMKGGVCAEAPTAPAPDDQRASAPAPLSLLLLGKGVTPALMLRVNSALLAKSPAEVARDRVWQLSDHAGHVQVSQSATTTRGTARRGRATAGSRLSGAARSASGAETDALSRHALALSGHALPGDGPAESCSHLFPPDGAEVGMVAPDLPL